MNPTYPYFFPLSHFKHTTPLYTTESLDHGNFVPEYDPVKSREPIPIAHYHGRRIDNIPENIKSSCLVLQLDGPPPLQILGAEILRLQHEQLALQEKQFMFQKAVALHMRNNYQLIAEELYRLIKNDPRLVEKIKADMSQESDLTVSQLFSQTEEAVAVEEINRDDLSTDWIAMGDEGAYTLVDIDADTVELVKSQLETLTKLSQSSTGSQQDILQEIATIERNLPKRPSKTWLVAKGTLTGVSTLVWFLMKTTVLVAHSAVIMAPTVAIMLPMIAPTAYLKLMLYLINLLQK